MDITTLGVGAIIGATVVAGTNLYIFISNRKKDEIKERLDNLYTPMYVYHMEHMRYGIEDPYKDYLELKKIYIRNSIYASDRLKELFESVIDAESEFMGLDEKERTEKMNHTLMKNDKGEEKDIKSLMYRISGWIHREYDELQIYYSKGKIARFLWRWKIHDDPCHARGTIPAGRSF
ncbi:MAG: hypothetical protein FAF03_01845 [Epsilonproteobacteria bacterium]|nr:hypothetical protein [Campylobacterota bacterium]